MSSSLEGLPHSHEPCPFFVLSPDYFMNSSRGLESGRERHRRRLLAAVVSLPSRSLCPVRGLAVVIKHLVDNFLH